MKVIIVNNPSKEAEKKVYHYLGKVLSQKANERTELVRKTS